MMLTSDLVKSPNKKKKKTPAKFGQNSTFHQNLMHTQKHLPNHDLLIC